MRPNLKDVLAVLESVKEGEPFHIHIDMKGWSCLTSQGDFVMGRDRRKTVRKAIDDAEKKFHLRRCENESRRGEVNDEDTD